MLKIKIICAAIISIFLAAQIIAQPISEDYNCYSMLAGKKSTADGSVLMAHNEDAGGDQYVDWHKVERMQHKPGSFITLEKGAKVEQVAETWAFLWLQVPGLQFSDTYLNEWGLAISSNQCLSREDNPQLLDGGIGYFLRRIMAERSKTAREAVILGGKLVEKYGYHSSGRTYLIADKEEAWMMAVVQGKHWVAQRIPDDHVAFIPNYYTIREIDLGDMGNFLGSKDIISYAIDRGWFDPDKGRRFSFREAYADPRTLEGLGNVPRHVDGINYLSGKAYGYYDALPFSFKAKKLVTVEDFMAVLGRHNEGTQFEVHPSYDHGNPHFTDIKRICDDSNKYAVVAQLRKNLPDPIAHVLWVAPKRPCIQPFIPWYVGVRQVMTEYSRGNPQECLAGHFSKKDIKAETESKAFRAFSAGADHCDHNYLKNTISFKEFKETTQYKLMANQPVFEQIYTELFANDPAGTKDLIDAYINNWAASVLNFTKDQMDHSK